jgi:hypothetical protein
VARRRGPARWATPRRGQGQGALGCGRLGFTRTSSCRNASSARRPASGTRPQRVARRRGPARWATPRRGQGQGALGCGRIGFTRTSSCRNASSA